MRSTFRFFMAAMLLTVAAGYASAQEASAPPPPAPDVAAPVAVLPQLPVTATAPVPDPNAPVVDPAVTVDPSALTVAPAAVAIVQPEPEKAVVATTTTHLTKKTAKKPADKPVAKPAIVAAQAVEPVPAPATAATGATAPAGASTLETLPPSNTAPAKSEAPPPAAANSVVDETPAEGTRTTMGLGGWLLALLVVSAMVGLITLLRRRRTQRKTSIMGLGASSPSSPDLIPAPVSRL